MLFSSSIQVWMWELDYKEDWAPKNQCFQTVVLEKTLESRLDSKETQPVNPKRNQPWIFIGRADAESEAPILWPPDAKRQLTGKDLDAGKDWGQEEKGMTGMRWLDGITEPMDMSLSKLQGYDEEQGSLVCYSRWVLKKSDSTERLINDNKQTINTNFFEWMKKW